MRNCLVIYIGNGYSESALVYDKTYSYSTDMRENYPNHLEKIFTPLKQRGYSIDVALLTNKHSKYDEFVDFYKAIPLEYEDINHDDVEILKSYYFFKSDLPPGGFLSGGRFLKLKKPIPRYEMYVMVRADAHFKMGLNELNVDYQKMNWLWPETDYRMYTEEKDAVIEEMGGYCWPWEHYNRVNGNILNVIPFKFFNMFSKYIWMEHLSFSNMMKDLYPLVTLDDINLMLGYEKCYVTDLRFTENPVYYLNKKIIDVTSDTQTQNYGVK